MSKVDLKVAIRFCTPLVLMLFTATFVHARPEERSLPMWMLSRFDTLPRSGEGSIRRCSQMERTQRTLTARRDSIAWLREQGRKRKDSCQNATCQAHLQLLRDSLKTLAGRESATRDSLGQESSTCPSDSWARWTRYRSLDSLLGPGASGDTSRSRSLSMERAELAWKGSLPDLLQEPGREASRLDVRVTEEFAHPRATCRWRLRHAFFLDWSGNSDSALGILARVGADSSGCGRESKLARHWMGSIGHAPDSVRMSLLVGSLDQPDLRPRGLVELSRLMARNASWSSAHDSLAMAIRLDPSLFETQALDSLVHWADRGGFDPLARLDPATPWLDQLLIARGRLLLSTARGRQAQGLLADFRLKFPSSPFGEEARALLGQCRR